MDAIKQNNQDNHEKKAKIVSLSFHVLLVLILILGVARSCNFQTPPPTQEGIMIAFGEIDAGGGQPEEGQPEEAPEETVEQTVEETVQETVEESEPAPAEEVTPTPVPDPKPDVKTTNADEIALKKKQEEAKKKKQEADKKKREADAKKKAENAKKAAAAAKKKAAAEAAAKAAADAKAKADALQAKKDKIGGTFGNKPGNGEGSNSGNAGDPNATNAGSGTGTGQVGGGLSNTGVKSKPNPPSNPGVEGNAVIKICVDPKGNVVSAEFTQSGSTITNGTAIKQAIANAKKWTFDANQMRADKVCGTITYKFDVK